MFWAEPIDKWVMIYGGRLPFVDPNGVLPSLTAAQVFDPTAGIYVRLADQPQGPWSAPRTIFNPFTSTFGYCEIMYFSDASGFLHQNHPGYFKDIIAECPTDGATRTAQKWWLDVTALLPDSEPDFQRTFARNAFGAEYGAAVLPQLIAPTPAGGVRFQWLLSTWIPYRVVVMETELGPGP